MSIHLDETVLQSKTAKELIVIIKTIWKPNQTDENTNYKIRQIIKKEKESKFKHRMYIVRGARNQKGGK